METIKKMLAGFRDFQRNYFDKDTALFDQLRTGQKPEVLVIACSDSRVDPALITGVLPGDIFVIRNVANLVPPYQNDSSTYHGVSAALEYAVRELAVRHIIILGHSHCGGIATLMKGRRDEGEATEFIDHWLNIGGAARCRVLEKSGHLSCSEQIAECELVSIEEGLNNLRTFPWIVDKEQEGKLFLHGWYFDLQEGTLQIYDPENGEFRLFGQD